MSQFFFKAGINLINFNNKINFKFHFLVIIF